MQLMERAHSSDGPLGWFSYERRNWLAAVAIAACAGFSWGNGHTTQNAIEDISKKSAVQGAVISKLKESANCQTVRARVATQVAVQSENGQRADLGDIPHCPLPPKVSPSAVAPTATPE